MTPRRIQRKRTKGWRMPPNTVYVGRPSRWGNPYRIDDVADAAYSVRLFRELVEQDTVFQSEIIAALRGKNLCCWCPLDQPCHADVLLEIAK